MLNFLLGVGISCMSAIVRTRDDYLELKVSKTVYISGLGTLLGLAFSLLWISINGFKAGRIYGIILITLYIITILLSIIPTTLV